MGQWILFFSGAVGARSITLAVGSIFSRLPMWPIRRAAEKQKE